MRKKQLSEKPLEESLKEALKERERRDKEHNKARQKSVCMGCLKVANVDSVEHASLSLAVPHCAVHVCQECFGKGLRTLHKEGLLVALKKFLKSGDK